MKVHPIVLLFVAIAMLAVGVTVVHTHNDMKKIGNITMPFGTVEFFRVVAGAKTCVVMTESVAVGQPLGQHLGPGTMFKVTMDCK